MTQPLLLEHLHDLGIEISAGQLNHLLTQKHEDFHAEKDGLLEAGLQVSNHIQVDDTGARHDGKNGYCTFIGNELFAWFESTQSKSRVNFLELLRAGRTDDVLNAGALEYMARHKLPQKTLHLLEEGKSFANKEEWDRSLAAVGITGPKHIRIATEGALTGSLLAQGFQTEKDRQKRDRKGHPRQKRTPRQKDRKGHPLFAPHFSPRTLRHAEICTLKCGCPIPYRPKCAAEMWVSHTGPSLGLPSQSPLLPGSYMELLYQRRYNFAG